MLYYFLQIWHRKKLKKGDIIGSAMLSQNYLFLLKFFVFIRFLLNSVKTTAFFKLLFAEALLGRMYP